MSVTDSDLMVLPDDPSDSQEEGKDKEDADIGEPPANTDVQAMDDSTQISADRYLLFHKI